jgi:hypothetical protein
VSNPVRDEPASRTLFFTLIRTRQQAHHARLLIESLRAFGGLWSDCPVWVLFPPDVDLTVESYHDMINVRLVPLEDEESFQHDFKFKVWACAHAEAIAGPEVRSLVWFAPENLILNPPTLFDLAWPRDNALARASRDRVPGAAFRTVHHRNIGSLAGEPLDDFWKTVYQAIGIDDAPFTIESFADLQTIRPYFNSHCFAIDPSQGIGRAWWACFEQLARDQAFQSGPCQDQLYQVFLHQAVLSTLVIKKLERTQIRLLPPAYSYPLHMHAQVPAPRQAKTLNDLVCAVYEEDIPLDEIAIQEPLRTWLNERVQAC